MYDKIKENVWDSEPYYNTGKGYIFTFDGAEGGRIWIEQKAEQDHLDTPSNIPLEHLDEFINFSKFVQDHIIKWQTSEEGQKRIKEIEEMNLTQE